jgi:hypothetical protein
MDVGLAYVGGTDWLRVRASDPTPAPTSSTGLIGPRGLEHDSAGDGRRGTPKISGPSGSVPKDGTLNGGSDPVRTWAVTTGMAGGVCASTTCADTTNSGHADSADAMVAWSNERERRALGRRRGPSSDAPARNSAAVMPASGMVGGAEAGCSGGLPTVPVGRAGTGPSAAVGRA